MTENSTSPSTIALSARAKGCVRKERIEKESYEETIIRVFNQLGMFRGDAGEKTKNDMVLIQSLLDYFGVSRSKIQRVIISKMKKGEQHKQYLAEQSINTERLKLKMNVVSIAVVCITFVVGLYGIFQYGI